MKTHTIPIGKVLVILVGPSGAGKSTFAGNFDPSEIVSSDAIRRELLGDLRRQDHGDVVFSEYHRRIATRLSINTRVVADATHLRDADRKKVAQIGVNHNAIVIYVVINRPLDEKIASGGWRNEVVIKGEGLIARHESLFVSNRAKIFAGDNLADVVIDLATNTPDTVEVVHPLSLRNPATDLLQRGFTNLRVVGDVHGNMPALYAALDAPEDTFFLFLGDVVDYGKHTLEAVDVVAVMTRVGKAISLRGNHERKIRNYIVGTRMGNFRGTLGHGNQITADALDSLSSKKRTEWEDRFLEFVELSPDHIQMGDWMFVHAAVSKHMWGNTIHSFNKNSKMESMALFGETTGEIDDSGFPVRKDDWVDELPKGFTAVVGHAIHAVDEVVILDGKAGGRAIMLDTGSSKEVGGVNGRLSWVDISIREDSSLQLGSLTLGDL